MSVLTTALPETANRITLYGPDHLDPDVVKAFLSCLKDTNVEYSIYVDETGIIVVLPTERRELDLEGIDEGLHKCIMAANDRLELAAESTVYDSSESKGATTVDSVTYSWISEQGGLGKKPVGTRPPTTDKSEQTLALGIGNNTSGPAIDQSLHYWSLVSSDKYCKNHDAQLSFPGNCHSHHQSYKSIEVENSSNSESLTMSIWPHHNCEKSDNRLFTIPPGSWSSCHSRTTYSYKGRFHKCAVC